VRRSVRWRSWGIVESEDGEANQIPSGTPLACLSQPAKRRKIGGRQQKDTVLGELLLAQTELGDDILIALGIVDFQVVEQATPLADQHEETAARAMILLMRFEVFRQLTNALA